ncbi:MAG: GntR family transcriptional regulator, partial [Deinococcota bacterium]
IVPEVTLEDLMEIFSIREYLEGLAARLATDHMSRVEVNALEQTILQTEAAMQAGDLEVLAKASKAFHRQILRGARNSRLPKLVSLLYDAHRPNGLHQLQDDRRALAVAEHRRIFEAIHAGDAAQAEEAMRAHIHEAFQHQVKMLHVE